MANENLKTWTAKSPEGQVYKVKLPSNASKTAVWNAIKIQMAAVHADPSNPNGSWDPRQAQAAAHAYAIEHPGPQGIPAQGQPHSIYGMSPAVQAFIHGGAQSIGVPFKPQWNLDALGNEIGKGIDHLLGHNEVLSDAQQAAAEKQLMNENPGSTLLGNILGNVDEFAGGGELADALKVPGMIGDAAKGVGSADPEFWGEIGKNAVAGGLSSPSHPLVGAALGGGLTAATKPLGDMLGNAIAKIKGAAPGATLGEALNNEDIKSTEKTLANSPGGNKFRAIYNGRLNSIYHTITGLRDNLSGIFNANEENAFDSEDPSSLLNQPPGHQTAGLVLTRSLKNAAATLKGLSTNEYEKAYDMVPQHSLISLKNIGNALLGRTSDFAGMPETAAALRASGGDLLNNGLISDGIAGGLNKLAEDPRYQLLQRVIKAGSRQQSALVLPDGVETGISKATQAAKAEAQKMEEEVRTNPEKWVVPLKSARNIKSVMGGLADYGTQNGDAANGALKRLTALLKSDINSGVSAISPDAADALRDADANYAITKGKLANIDKLVNNNLSPHLVARRLLSDASSGGDILFKQITDHLTPPERAIYSASLLHELGRIPNIADESSSDASAVFSHNRFLKNYGGLPSKVQEQIQSHLMSPEHSAAFQGALDNMNKLREYDAILRNNSGTGASMTWHRSLEGALDSKRSFVRTIKEFLGNHTISHLLTSPSKAAMAMKITNALVNKIPSTASVLANQADQQNLNK